jgi:hypothetical protein
MRRLLTVTGTLATMVGLTFASGSSADRDRGTPEFEGQSAALLADSDGDGVLDEDDNCVEVPNEDQADFDLDGVGDVCDNCSEAVNPAQDDCDDDFCGNLCDCDYDQSGACGWGDFGLYSASYGLYDSTCQQHVEPISPDRAVGFPDFGFFAANFGQRPGPSGTTPGTVACPIWEP